MSIGAIFTVENLLGCGELGASQRVVCWRSMLWRVPITRIRPLETMVRSIRNSLIVGLFQRVEGSGAPYRASKRPAKEEPSGPSRHPVDTGWATICGGELQPTPKPQRKSIESKSFTNINLRRYLGRANQNSKSTNQPDGTSRHPSLRMRGSAFLNFISCFSPVVGFITVTNSLRPILTFAGLWAARPPAPPSC